MEYQREDEGLQSLTGTVERVVFRNEENGWTVLELEAEDELHKVVGVLPSVNVGERLRLLGAWVEHASFGHQFRAEHCESQLPTNAAAILRYLSSGAVKGVGSATAVRIVEKFGEETLNILEQDPLRLAEIRGISRDKAKKIGEDFASQFGLREVMMTFSPYGLTPNEALRCWKKWGAATIKKIRDNPYLLCSTGLYIGFERADQICMAMNGEADSANRIEAGLQYILRHNLNNGHTCLPADKLVPTAVTLLNVPLERIEAVLAEMIAGLDVREVVMGGRSYIYLPHLYQACLLYTSPSPRD